MWFTGFDKHIPLLKPDGYYYQTREQNPFMSFRDPYTFNDPANPGKTYMLFAGNSSGVRGNTPCNADDLGYQPGEKYSESLDQVNSSPAIFNRANVGLAVATKDDLTQWRFLPPIISANCTNDQLERPQMYMQDGDYCLMTISHRFTFAEGLDGPDGEYGFYGHGIRSEWIPLNASSGLVLGNPTNLQIAAGADWGLNPEQNLNTYQSYAHYVMPGGKVQSFIDMVQYRWGGSLAPIVHLNFQGPNTAVDMQYGQNGLGAYGDISANVANTNIAGMMQDMRSSSSRR
ncbi:glycoside hydrolase family 68 protein [Neokomagataea sp. TBRC 2177]|uniref:Glycoside hydrolase family 68 protein n=1 Tax=Neokomagataea anthophila TaxID=2826925 RepID=A0ABS5E9H3_9PROT|nr:glycoside hydrolase family 68 protein [Neokomagataea anthophila]